MEYIARYIHGSEDSLDIDTFYVVSHQPSFSEAKAFCDGIADENANVITISDGIVTDCYKGTPDEVNNSLIDTYNLHQQDYPLLVERRVERDVFLKYIRAVRGVLSYLSRTKYRSIIKPALRGTWKERLEALSSLNLCEVDFENLGKNFNGADIKKVIAFQIGQSLGLHEGNEYYTKKSIGERYEGLYPYLYRMNETDNTVLQEYLGKFLDMLAMYPYTETSDTLTFSENNKYSVRDEVRL